MAKDLKDHLAELSYLIDSESGLGKLSELAKDP